MSCDQSEPIRCAINFSFRVIKVISGPEYDIKSCSYRFFFLQMLFNVPIHSSGCCAQKPTRSTEVHAYAALCQQKVMNIPTFCETNVNPSEYRLMKRKVDELLDSWKIFARRQISREMEEMSSHMDTILRSKMKSLLIFLRNIMCRDRKEMSDLDKWIVNGILFSPAETIISLEQKQPRKVKCTGTDIENVKRCFSHSPEETFFRIEKQKCYDRYLQAKQENLCTRVTKVIYFLRKLYINKDSGNARAIPRFILELMCGYDPQDHDLDIEYASKTHSKRHCLGTCVSVQKCQITHFDVGTFQYAAEKPQYAQVYDYIISNLL